MRRAPLSLALGVLVCAFSSAVVGGEEALSPEAREAAGLLDATDAFTRQLGFMRLEALREPATAQVVRSYVDSPDPMTRAFSLRALGAIEGQAAVPLLLERLQGDHHARVRAAALLALEPLADPRIPPALIARLQDPDPEVRMAAVDAVSRLNSEQARAAIRVRRRREHHRDVRRVLEQAMKRIGHAPAAPPS